MSPLILLLAMAQPLAPMPPFDDFKVITERNLFDPSRRTVASGATSASAGSLNDQWKLSGIVLEGSQRLALFDSSDGKQSLRLQSGMPLDERWQVLKIEADCVVLGSGTEEVRLELRELQPNNKDSKPRRKPGKTQDAGNGAPQQKGDGG